MNSSKTDMDAYLASKSSEWLKSELEIAMRKAYNEDEPDVDSQINALCAAVCLSEELQKRKLTL